MGSPAIRIIGRMNTPTGLNERQKKHLRGLGHALHPLVSLGQHGLTDSVVAELDRALTDHELVKVKVRVGERAERDEAFNALSERTASQLVSRIGHVGLYFRPRAKASRIVLPG